MPWAAPSYKSPRTMDLPYDIKEIIGSHLNGADLANMSIFDKDFRPSFIKTVAPVFMTEFVRVSKIFDYLRNIFHLKACSHDIMEDGGDHKAMSYVLGREIEEGELYEDQMEYTIWNTFNWSIDMEPNMEQLMDEYMRQENDYNSFLENDIDDILDEYWDEHGYIPGDYL